MVYIESDFFYIKKKLAMNMFKFEASEVSGGSCCNSNRNDETKNYAANFLYGN